jgi:hypothetical protein
MSLDSKSAAALIVATYAKSVPADERKGIPEDFCKLWPKAKPVLSAVAMIVLLFPGLGQTAAGILNGLIAVGDKIAADTCK